MVCHLMCGWQQTVLLIIMNTHTPTYTSAHMHIHKQTKHLVERISVQSLEILESNNFVLFIKNDKNENHTKNVNLYENLRILMEEQRREYSSKAIFTVTVKAN